MMFLRRVFLVSPLIMLAAAANAKPLNIGIVAFQMSSETHARAANAAEAAAKAKGWTVTVLNSRGSIPESATQIETLISAHVDALVLCMTKPVELDAQLAAAKQAGIPVITIASGSSPHTLFDIQANEYQVGSDATLYLFGLLNYRGNILAQRFEGNLATRIRGRELDAVLAENTGIKLLGSHSMARTAAWQEDVRAGMNALLQREQGNFQGIWASFDGQAFVIDDLLQQTGVTKGKIPIVSMDGGQETFRRIRDPGSLVVATVAVPFELMGSKAVDALDAIVVNGAAKESVVKGPYMLLPSVLVDRSNVPAEGKWPW
jgi:simple sugar transport system substrate-binding protein/ribose transport system substrate-binding protein